MKRIAAASILMIGLAITPVVGCAGPAKESDDSSAKTSNDKAGEAYSPDIDPANFVDKVDNKYFPLEPGTTFVYEGKDEEGFERIEVSVTNDTKQIMGVECVVVRDRVWIDGELVEDTFDWHAQDKGATSGTSARTRGRSRTARSSAPRVRGKPGWTGPSPVS